MFGALLSLSFPRGVAWVVLGFGALAQLFLVLYGLVLRRTRWLARELHPERAAWCLAGARVAGVATAVGAIVGLFALHAYYFEQRAFEGETGLRLVLDLLLYGEVFVSGFTGPIFLGGLLGLVGRSRLARGQPPPRDRFLPTVWIACAGVAVFVGLVSAAVYVYEDFGIPGESAFCDTVRDATVAALQALIGGLVAMFLAGVARRLRRLRRPRGGRSGT